VQPQEVDAGVFAGIWRSGLKRKLLGIFACCLVICGLFHVVVPIVYAENCRRYWAVIICGSQGTNFWADTQYMYHVLHDHYTFAGIDFLSVDTNRLGANVSSTKTNVRNAITGWLHDHAGANDRIFIFFDSHGGGYQRDDGFGSFSFKVVNLQLGIVSIPDSALLGHRVSLDQNDENNAHEIQESSFKLFGCPRLSAPPNMVYYDLDDDGHNDDFYMDWYQDGTIYMCVDVLGNNTYPDTGQYTLASLPYVDIDGDGLRDDLFADVGLNNKTNVLIDAAAAWTSDGIDSNNDGNITGVDFRGDGNQNGWVGVDESCQVLNDDGVNPDVYWDDELKSDLSCLSYDKLIFVREGCVVEDQSCFSGGLIDDLSGPNRIITCASNETTESWAHTYGFGCWAGPFIDAMHGGKVTWNGTAIVHTGERVDADLNHDGVVTVNETWWYAWNHDEKRIDGSETPWRDDNGDGLPTYKDGQDVLGSGDGSLSDQIVLEPNLLTVLIGLGYDENKLLLSSVETFNITHWNATLCAEFADWHASNNLSWYAVGTTSWNLIFSGLEGGFGYVYPPITHSFSPTSTFGLSFCTSEHRYFTQNGNNPDGFIHSRVYRYLDNPKMYLIGFENWYGDGSDKDYNDMVIALENVNNPPVVPKVF